MVEGVERSIEPTTQTQEVDIVTGDLEDPLAIKKKELAKEVENSAMVWVVRELLGLPNAEVSLPTDSRFGKRAQLAEVTDSSLENPLYFVIKLADLSEEQKKKQWISEQVCYQKLKGIPYFSEYVGAIVLPDGKTGATLLKYFNGIRLKEWAIVHKHQQEKNNEGRISKKSMVQVLLQITQALTAMHARGVAHGDVSSQNGLVPIHFGENQTADESRLMDIDNSPQVVGDGVVQHTAPYTAPERFAGFKSGGFKDDIYGLGILFQFLFKKNRQLNFTIKPRYTDSSNKLISQSISFSSPLDAEIYGKMCRNYLQGKYKSVVLAPLRAEEVVFTDVTTSQLDQFNQLIAEMCQFEYRKRPTMARVLERLSEIFTE